MKACDYIKFIRKTLHSEKFQNKHKTKPTDFSRKSILESIIVFIFILKGIKNSLQTELFYLIDKASLPAEVTKQAFSKARKKLSASAFEELNDLLIRKYYRKNKKKLSKWKGYIVLAADGSTLQLPNHIETKKKYGFATNQYEEKVSMGRSVHVYDPLSQMIISGNLNPYNSCERDGLYALMDKILAIKKCGHKKILLILDRYYPSHTLIQFLVYHGIDYLIRCKQDFSSKIKEIVKDGIKDSTTTEMWKYLTRTQKLELDKFNIIIKDQLPVRVILIDLPESEDEKLEVLITSLTDKKSFKPDCFKELYFSRWGIEENLKFWKSIIEIENFGGMTPIAVEQEFHATILVSNIRAILANEAQELLDEDHIINKNISLSAVKLDLINVLLNPKSNIEEFCNKIKRRMTRASVAIRPGRKYPRVRKRTRQKFHNHLRKAAG